MNRMQQVPPGTPSPQPNHPENDPIRPQAPIPPGDPQDPPLRIPPGDPVAKARALARVGNKASDIARAASNAKKNRVIAKLAARKPEVHGHAVKQEHGVPPQKRTPEKTTTQRLDEELQRAEGEGMVPEPKRRAPAREPAPANPIAQTEADRRRSHVAR